MPIGGGMPYPGCGGGGSGDGTDGIGGPCGSERFTLGGPDIDGFDIDGFETDAFGLKTPGGWPRPGGGSGARFDIDWFGDIGGPGVGG